MALKYRFNLKDIKLEDFKVYLLALFKAFIPKKKIKNINSPIIVMHGEIDQIVPFSMGKKIYEIANEPKYSYFTKYDNHMMEYDEKLVLALKSFLKSLN